MITAAEARDLAQKVHSGNLDQILEQIEAISKSGSTQYIVPESINLTYGDLNELHHLGYGLSESKKGIAIDWGL